MPLSRHSVGIYQETRSHASRQGTPGYSRLRSLSHCGLIPAERIERISVRELISTLKKKKKKRKRGMNGRTFSPNPRGGRVVKIQEPFNY